MSMGVYIRGMEIPKSCAECPVNMDVCKRGYKYLLVHMELYDQRADDCPITTVPLHGDLIDADKLVELCDIMANECVNKCDGIGATIWHQFKATVEWSPIVIPAEEGE